MEVLRHESARSAQRMERLGLGHLGWYWVEAIAEDSTL